MDTNNYDKLCEKGMFGISVSHFAQENWWTAINQFNTKFRIL